MTSTETKETLWGCLGIIASVNEQLARTSINFLSCNLILWLLLFSVVYHAIVNASHGFNGTGIVWGLLWLLISVPISFVVLGGIISMGTRSTIFRKHGDLKLEPPDNAAAYQEVCLPANVQVTGHFRLEGKHTQRFVCMPAALQQINVGSICAYVHIDASQKLSGFTIAKRDGVWTVEIYPWLIMDMDTGTQYWDGSQPSLRFRHHRGLSTYRDPDDVDFKHEIILAFNSEADRNDFVDVCRHSKRPLFYGG